MRVLFFVTFFIVSLSGFAQNDRLKDENDIAWSQLYLTLPVAKKWDILAEYQWRRVHTFKDWQQSLLRLAIQHRINQQLSAAIGYGWIETFPYGDFPLAANGTFPEHRIYEQVQLRNTFGKLGINQRLRIEQRWLGRRAVAAERKIEEWLFSNRFRYFLRLQHPISKAGTLYLAAADEVFINAGKNVGVNIFDQNRLMFLMGAKLHPKINLEAGYLSQTVIQGRRVNNSTIVQDNQGLLLSLYLSL